MNLRHSARAARVLALLVLSALTASVALAQDTVRGTVTDAVTGEALPGVSVAVLATVIGTTTDGDGRYEIVLPAGRTQLQFSFVGFRTRVVDVPSGTTALDVALEEDVLGLDEVVVSGIATSVRRANSANSVEVISGRDLAERTTNQTLGDAISGKVTGAVVTSNTGAPGGGISFRLRGITTINGSSQPLFIVDGLVFNNDAIANGINAVTAAAAGGSASNQDNPVNRIADINPDDIASIEVLKGPSAAAIYGARASNGVVIITTKRGDAGGGVQFSVNQSLGVTSLANRLGTRQFTEESAIAQFTTDPGPEATPDEIAEYQAAIARIRGLYRAGAADGFYDYEEALYGNDGFLSTTTLAASGGNDRTQFYASGEVKDDEGIIAGTGYERQSARINLTHRFSGRAQADLSTNYVRSETRRSITGNDNTGTSLGVALSSTPNFVDLAPDEEGIYPANSFGASNPLQTVALADIGETNDRVTASGQFSYGLVQGTTQALQAVVEGGADFYSLESSLVFPVDLQFYQERALSARGQSIQGRSNNLNLTLRSALVHTLNLPESRLLFTTQGGFSVFSQNQDVSLARATGLIPGQENVDQAAALAGDQNRLFQDDRALFGQTEANWADRVVGSLGLRAERSSLNGDVSEYFLYPKASLAVNVAQFDFWTADALDVLKLRLAYGETGNTAPFGSRFTTFGSIAIGGNAGLNINLQRGFADVVPERAREVEGGLDLSGLDGRFSLELTGYRKVVDNLLLTRQVPFSTGFTTETLNGGELTNTGVEVGLSLIPVTSDVVEWVTRTSFWTYSSEVTRLDVPAFQAAGGGFGNTLGSIRIEEGQSPTQIVGIDDTDGDGTSDGVFQLGDAAPDFQMSFANDVTLFRNLRLSVFAHWKKGGDNINLSELLYDLGGVSPDYDDDDDGDGVINGEQRTGQLGTSARVFVQDASYFKVREVGLYYTVPDRYVQRALPTVRNFRVGVSGNNLLTITPYESYDPEVNNFGDVPVATGVEVTPFPSSRSFLFHVGFGL